MPILNLSFLKVQFELNGGEPVASSIPATEHSVMTAWASEREAIENMIQHFGGGLFSVVMDSYDYAAVSFFVFKCCRNAFVKQLDDFIEHFGSGLFPVVMDGYDYAAVSMSWFRNGMPFHSRLVNASLAVGVF